MILLIKATMTKLCGGFEGKKKEEKTLAKQTVRFFLFSSLCLVHQAASVVRSCGLRTCKPQGVEETAFFFLECYECYEISKQKQNNNNNNKKKKNVDMI